MHVSPVLDPFGRPVYSVGGRHSWKTITFKDFSVSFEWVIGSGNKRKAPCLCIWKTGNVFAPGDGGDRGIWTIGRRGYERLLGTRRGDPIKLSGDPSTYLFSEARKALPILGFDENDRNALRNLVDCVIHCAEDFNRMPVTPTFLMEKERSRAMWEVKAINKATGKVVTEAEV